jgi:hypothetical protein
MLLNIFQFVYFRQLQHAGRNSFNSAWAIKKPLRVVERVFITMDIVEHNL